MSPLSGPPRFGRVVTAMVTPFDEAGALDVDAAIDTVVNDLCRSARPLFLFLDDVHALLVAGALRFAIAARRTTRVHWRGRCLS